MTGIISRIWSLTSQGITLLTPDFFQLFYTGFVLFCLYTATWMLSVKMRDATLVNFLWGISFSLQSVIYFYKSLENSIFSFYTEKFSWEKMTFSMLVFAHGLRLSSYLITREVGQKEDRRFAAMREKFGGSFWWMSYFLIFMPAMVINMLMGSVIYAFSNVDKNKIGHLTYWAGIFTMLFGGLLGALADIQKYTFKSSRRNEGKIMDKGLWSISRHPNYLGEIIFWWGVYMVNFSAGILWTIVCPIALSLMIMFISGIPVAERMMQDEFGDAYTNYCKQVPILLPFIGGLTTKGSKIGSESSENKSDEKFQAKSDQFEGNRSSFGADNRQKVQ